jgi:flagellar FliJ protein
MKKFTFKLQTLLNVKLSQEKEKTSELANQTRVCVALEDELNGMYARMNATAAEYNAKMERGGMSPGDAIAYTQGFRAARDNIAAQNERIKRAEKVRERIRGELQELMSERKMLEKFRENQHAEYLEEVKRDEAKQIDDFLSNKIAGEE